MNYENRKVIEGSQNNKFLLIDCLCLLVFIAFLIYVYFINDASIGDILTEEKYDNDFARLLALGAGNFIEFTIYCGVFAHLYEQFSIHYIRRHEVNHTMYYLVNIILAIIYSFLLICALLLSYIIAMIASLFCAVIGYCIGNLITIFLSLPFTLFD